MLPERIPSGIPGFDKLIEGGFDRGSVNLLSGKIGTGKSIFSSQFLYAGATQYTEKGLFITTDEGKEHLYKQLDRFGWDFPALEKSGMIKVMEFDPFDVPDLAKKIGNILDYSAANRIIVDSLSMYELSLKDSFRIRKSLFGLLKKIRMKGKTTILTAEIPEDQKTLSRSGVIEFLADSVIILNYTGMTKHQRTLIIRKMRTTKHSAEIHPFKITAKGIVIGSV